MTKSTERWLYGVWAVLILGFAVLHALNLRADFPNHSPWFFDGAKYTDEGWWATAAIHAHFTGNWHAPMDYNSAPVVPVWPFTEWLLFSITGVSIVAARGLAVAFFFANLILSYFLLRKSGKRWTAFLALTLLVTSPFIYSFGRLALLEPMLLTFTLAALNLAIRLPQSRHQIWNSVAIGSLFTLMLLTKTTAVFLLPALWCAVLLPMRTRLKQALFCLAVSTGTSAAGFALWMMWVVHSGMMGDYQNFFYVNRFIDSGGTRAHLHHLLGVFHTGLMTDGIFIPMALVLALAAFVAWRHAWGRNLLLDPVFSASLIAIAGYLGLMAYHNYHPPRYFTVVTLFCFLLVAKGVEALIGNASPHHTNFVPDVRHSNQVWHSDRLPRLLGFGALALISTGAIINGVSTIQYAVHPEYTFAQAAQSLTQFIDAHPNGKRLLVSVSGDEIALVTHLSTLCAPSADGPCSHFPDPASELALRQPGWYAEWNSVNPSTLEIIHTHFSIEQVASYRAFDFSERNLLVLFKLHPLPAGKVRDPATENLRVRLPDDKIQIPIA